MKRFSVCTVLLIGCCGLAAASDNRPYILMQGGFNFGSSVRTADYGKREVEEGGALGLLVHIPYEPDTATELFVTHKQSGVDLPGRPDMAVTHLQFGGIKYVEDGRVKPFVGASVGIAGLKLKPGNDAFKPGFSLYGGLEWPFARHALMRVEARWLGVFFDSATTIRCSGDSCSLRFDSGVWSEVEVQAGLGFSF